ncbi:hypothetical protein K525DRAFT_212062 [Schizophyllum commune Loenen D]|nr:hypothetical protein K525DRAFT_212062 [Schizophyllum commune Loenen D]
MGPMIDGFGGIPVTPYSNAWLDHCSGFSSSQFGQYNQAGAYPAASSPSYVPYPQQAASMPPPAGTPSFTTAPFRSASSADSNKAFFPTMFPTSAGPPPSPSRFPTGAETVASSYGSSSPHSFSSMSSSSTITIPRRSSRDSDVAPVPLATQPAPSFALSSPFQPARSDLKTSSNLISDSPTPTPHPTQTNTPVAEQNSIVLEKACPSVEDLPIGPSKPVTVLTPDAFDSLDTDNLPRQVKQAFDGPPRTYPETRDAIRAGPLAPVIVSEYYRFHHESVFHTCIPRIQLSQSHNRIVDGFRDPLPVYEFELVDIGKAEYIEIRSAMMLQVVELRDTPPSNVRRRRNIPEAIVVGDELRRDEHHVEFLAAYYRNQGSHVIVLTTRKVAQCKLISREASWHAFMANLQRLVGLRDRLGTNQLAEAVVQARRQARHHVYENVHAACSGVRAPRDRDSWPHIITEAQSFIPYMMSYFALPTS